MGERLTRRSHDETDLLMVAGGTGLAPLRAVIEQIDQEWQRSRTAPRVHLLHGVRMPWHLYDRPWLRELANQRPWFDYTEVVSDDPSYPGTRGTVGRVAARQARHGRTAMVCGGPQMVAHTLEQLTGSGMQPEDITVPAFPPNLQINDPTNRLDLQPGPPGVQGPYTPPAGTFSTPGRYLILCNITPHFAVDNMYGWVIVK